MKVVILSSGSRGNTTYIECNNTKILIDIGNSYKYVLEKLKGLNVNAEEVDAIFITHTHIDHIRGLKLFVKNYNPKVFITKGMLNDLNFLNCYEIMENNILVFKDFVVNVIKTSHDSPDSVGFVIEGENKSIVYITDTGYINNKYFNLLKDKEVYIIESNYDIEMLNNGTYNFKLRQRILGDKGHLSNYDSSRYLSNFVGEKTHSIVLAHLSEENNTISLAYNSLIDRLDENNLIVKNILIAKQDEVTEEIIV